jgi:glycosyltransferase involved in cell wall biosynthesis
VIANPGAVGSELLPLSFQEDATVLLTVLMPCLNEARTVATCIRKARAWIARSGLDAEVVVADNGSTDGSQEIALREGARVVRVPVRGYGAALYFGTLHARGRYIIMGDADDSYDFGHLDAFLTKLRAGADLVMGNRFLGGIAPGAMPWKNRHIGNPALSGIGRLFFHCPVHDLHCGLRGYSREAFSRMRLQTSGMEFASEMVIKATLLGMTVIEVPTTLSKDGRDHPPHLRPWRDGWRHLRFMLLYSPRWLFLYPGLFLMIMGTLTSALVLPGPLVVNSIELDVHTLLYSTAAVVIGFHGVAFAFCARMYALHEGLLPEDPLLERLLDRFTLETGLTVGAVLLAAGFGGALYSLARWSATGFGPLDPRVTLRAAIPAAAAMCLGGEIVLTSFFLSFLGLRRLRSPSAQ